MQTDGVQRVLDDHFFCPFLLFRNVLRGVFCCLVTQSRYSSVSCTRDMKFERTPIRGDLPGIEIS